MKTVLALLVLLCIGTPAFALDLTAPDKQKHMMYSAGFAVGTGSLAIAHDGLTLRSGAVALLVANLPGIGKEIADDGTPGNFFDIGDIAANVVGSFSTLCIMKLGYTVYVTPRYIGFTKTFD